MFQLRWLELHRWLAYSSCPDYRGGWCLSCLLFPSNNEKEKLVVFVNPLFTNYNKSKEQLDSQETKEYCKLSIGHSFSHCLFDHNTASLKIKLMFTSTKEHQKIHRKIFRFYSRHSRPMCQAATCIVWTHRQ